MKTCVIPGQEKVALFKINAVYHVYYIRQISKHPIMYLKYILDLPKENLKLDIMNTKLNFRKKIKISQKTALNCQITYGC